MKFRIKIVKFNKERICKIFLLIYYNVNFIAFHFKNFLNETMKFSITSMINDNLFTFILYGQYNANINGT